MGPAAAEVVPGEAIVRVHDDAGHVGIGSGDEMHGFAGYERHFLGEDPLDLGRHATVLANIDFHAGRPWPLDVRAVGPCRADRGAADLVPRRRTGSTRPRVRLQWHPPPDRRHGGRRPQARSLGFPALKVRFGRPSLDADLAVIRAIRDDLGSDLELMVDCNQGWRMPWDTRPPWDLERATEVAQALAGEQLTWIEEPLHRGDYDGLAELRRRVDVAVAGGELTASATSCVSCWSESASTSSSRTASARRASPGLRSFAVEVDAAGKVFTPHTWGNGIGLLANAHLTAGTVDAPFLEFPFDPPEWTSADATTCSPTRSRSMRMAG